MDNRLDRFFPIDHVAAVGHFPGNPIIPGAVLLNDIVGAIGSTEDGSPMSYEVSSAKFLHPVRPGDNVTIAWEKRTSGEIRFECLLMPGDKKVLTGVLKFVGGRI